MTSLVESSIQLQAPLDMNLAASAGIAEEHIGDWAGPEKRKERRYPTCDPVDVFLLDFAGLRVSGMLRDVSKNGFRVEIDLPVHKGAWLKLTLRDQIIFAVTRYCRRTSDTYQVGAAIEWICGARQMYMAGVSRTTAGENVQPDDRNSAAQERQELASAIIDCHMFL